MTSSTTDRRLGLTGSAAIKVPCKAATTANITLSGEQTVDGVSCVTGDRVLVKSQTSSINNGIYEVDTGTWTRDLDFDGANDVVTGTIVMVLNGSANQNTYWRVTTTGTITFGSSAITFAPALAGDSATVSFLQTGTGAVVTTIQAKDREVVSAFDFMTAAQVADVISGALTLDVSAAIQTALAASKSVFCPAGSYKISTPVTLAGSERIYGVNSSITGSGRTVFAPATAAFKSSAPTSQLQELEISDIFFSGGSNPIDLALFHRVNVHDCQFWNFTGCGIGIVRGERHKFERLEFVLQTTLADACFAFGDYTKSVDSVALSGVAFGSAGQWVDRLTMHNIACIGTPGSATINWGYAIWAKAAAGNSNLSGLSLDDFTCYGGTLGVLRAQILQISTLKNLIVDSLASGALASAASVISAVTCQYVTFEEINPSFAGNNDYVIGFEIVTTSVGVTFTSCYAAGDNAATFGFKFPNNAGMTGNVLIGCTGSVYSAGANALVRGQLQSIGCYWTNNNTGGGNNVWSGLGQNFNVLFMNDTNGAAIGTGVITTTHSSGGGQSVTAIVTGDAVSGNVGDNAKTLTVRKYEKTQIWGSPLAADRAVTLDTTGALNSDEFHIVRKAASTGAFNLNVGTGPLKALATGQWCVVAYDGSAWFLKQFGSL